MIVIVGMAAWGHYQTISKSQSLISNEIPNPNDQKKLGFGNSEIDSIRRNTILETLGLLLITLLFYILYSPSSWVPVLEALGSFGRLLELDNFFLLAAYFGILYIAGAVIYVAYKHYRGSVVIPAPVSKQGVNSEPGIMKGFFKFFLDHRVTRPAEQPFGRKPEDDENGEGGGVNALIHKLIYRTFIIFFCLFAFSAFAYPGAYSPITDFAADVFSVESQNFASLQGDQNANLLTRLRHALTKTGANLSDNIIKTNQDLVTDLKDTKDRLGDSITQSQKDLKLQLEQQLTTGAATVEGQLIIKNLTTTQDIVPESDTAYDLGSASKSWNSLYVHQLHGASAVTIGASGSSHGVNASDDLVVSGDAEVKGTFYADSGTDNASNKIVNVASPTQDNDAANKTYVDNLVGTAAFLERSGTTISPVNSGDSLNMDNGDIAGVNNLIVAAANATTGTITTITSTNATVSGTITAGTVNVTDSTVTGSLSVTGTAGFSSLTGTTGSFTNLTVSSAPSSNTAAVNKLYVDSTVSTAVAGYDTFLELTDTPDSYSGSDGEYLKVSGSEVVFGSIAWDDVAKTSSSLGDLETVSASDISSGNLAVARMPTGGSWDLSSDLNVGSNTLYVDQTHNRVGIGTNSLGAKLDLKVSANGDKWLNLQTSGDAGLWWEQVTYGADPDWALKNSQGTLLEAYNSSNKITIENGLGVGMSGSLPNEALEVTGNVRTSGVYKIGTDQVLSRGNGSLAGNIVVGNGGGSLIHDASINGYYNTLIGLGAGTALSYGYYNTALGGASLAANTTGFQNTAVGYGALFTSNAHYNTAVGVGALYSNTSGTENTALGVNAGSANQTGNYNVLIGKQAGAGVATNSYSNNTFIGHQTGYSTTTGGNNFFGGYQAGFTNATGTNNVFIGYQAGYSNTASYNTFLGYLSGYTNSTGVENTFVGSQAGYTNLDGNYNTFMGRWAGKGNTSGSNNVMMGQYSGYQNTTGSTNTFIGYYSGQANTTGASNVAMGGSAGSYNQTGNYNTLIGNGAGYDVAANSYSNNTFIGYQTGYSTTTGGNNFFGGYQAGFTNATGTNNVFLGYQAGYYETGSNKLFIDNVKRASEADGRTKALVYGVFDAATANQSLTVNGNFGVNTATFGTNATNTIAIANGVAPTTSPADEVQLYAVDYDDEDGNATNLSPHNFSLLGGPSEEMAWSYYSERGNKVINADITRALRVVEELSGESLIHIKNKDMGEEQPQISSVGKIDEIANQLALMAGGQATSDLQSTTYNTGQDGRIQDIESRITALENQKSATGADSLAAPNSVWDSGLPSSNINTNTAGDYRGEINNANSNTNTDGVGSGFPSSDGAGSAGMTNKNCDNDNIGPVPSGEEGALPTWAELQDDIVTVVKELIVTAKTTFGKTVNFLAEATFWDKVTFKKEVTINGHPANGSEAGVAKIKKGDKKVEVKFANDFDSAPVVTAAPSGEPALYQVKDESKNGFAIQLSEDARNDVSFNWIAQEATNGVFESKGNNSKMFPPYEGGKEDGVNAKTENVNTNENTNAEQNNVDTENTNINSNDNSSENGNNNTNANAEF